MYKNLLKNPSFYEIKYPETIVPSPTDDDYSVGFIRRYFVRKTNDVNGHVFEISEKVYKEYIASESPFWIYENIKWRITGPKNSYMNNDGIITDIGVINSNKASITLGAVKIPNLKLYLPNLMQFHRG